MGDPAASSRSTNSTSFLADAAQQRQCRDKKAIPPAESTELGQGGVGGDSEDGCTGVEAVAEEEAPGFWVVEDLGVGCVAGGVEGLDEVIGGGPEAELGAVGEPALDGEGRDAAARVPAHAVEAVAAVGRARVAHAHLRLNSAQGSASSVSERSQGRTLMGESGAWKAALAAT